MLGTNGRLLNAQQVATAETGRAIATVMEAPVTVSIEHLRLDAAMDVIARAAHVRLVYDSRTFGQHAFVTLKAEKTPLQAVLRDALRGTGFEAALLRDNLIAIRENGLAASVEGGSIQGTVSDAKTHRPIRGATAVLDDVKNGVMSGEDGQFRIANVATGTHVVHVKVLGYGKVTKSVTVREGEVTTLEMQLDPSVNALEQVVVTGTVVPTELKAVSNAITVITAKELQDRGITRIDQLFRGDVPGLFVQRTGSLGASDGQGRGYPGRVNVWSRGSANLNGAADGIKTYVDGVELADKTMLGLIDPSMIDRIEIVTGPQASTLYGSNAITGVMQIFTKRGSTVRPQLTADLRSAWTQNNFNAALAPKHNTNLSLSGVEGRISYNVGGSWGYTGSWSPSVSEQILSGDGGERVAMGPLTLDLHLRMYHDQNRRDADDELQASEATGANGLAGYIGGAAPTRRRGESLDRAGGGSVTFPLASWWSHTVELGVDQLTQVNRKLDPSYGTLSDTTRFLYRDAQSRFTGKYNTTAQVPLTVLAKLVVTAGVEESHAATSSSGIEIVSASGREVPRSTGESHAHEHGGFLESQLGLWDALFVTYGLRAVYNPNIGKDQNPNWEPHYGIAYSREFAGVTAKVRAGYGTATRPPELGLKDGVLDPYNDIRRQYYGIDLYQVLPNPELLPSSQQGGEGGLELYLGNRGSLQITRFNQTVDHLVVAPVVDSVDLLPAERAKYGAAPWQYPFRMSQNINIGSVRNQGWEGQGTLNFWQLTATGTYSWTKSRMIGITRKYRNQFPMFVVGAPVSFAPEHTYAMGLAYVHGGTRIGYNLQGQASWRELAYSWNVRTGNYNARTNYQSGSRARYLEEFVNVRPGYYLGDLNASQHVTAHVEATVQINNLHNSYQSELPQTIAQAGRTTAVGLRLHW